MLCEDHVDNGLVTLSLITDNPSLEIHRLDDKFHMEEMSVSGANTECIIWVGEQMEKITNGFYKPVRHRVLQPSANPPWYRVAMPFFMRGRPDAVINSTQVSLLLTRFDGHFFDLPTAIEAKRIKAKRPGMLSKYETMTMRHIHHHWSMRESLTLPGVLLGSWQALMRQRHYYTTI